MHEKKINFICYRLYKYGKSQPKFFMCTERLRDGMMMMCLKARVTTRHMIGDERDNKKNK